jgi:hypothetical protein
MFVAEALRPCGVIDDDETLKNAYDVVPYVASCRFINVGPYSTRGGETSEG